MKLNKEYKKCPTCGGRMVYRMYVHTENVGRYKVKDSAAQAPVCQDCGEVELSLEELADYQRRAAAIVLRESKPIEGAVIKYARRALGLKQAELAKLLDVVPETMCRWETDAKEMPRHMQLALVAILDGVERVGGSVARFIEQERDRKSTRHVAVHPVAPVRRVAG